MRSLVDKAHWCIVVADEPGPERRIVGMPGGYRPVQYTRLDETATPFQRALGRAATLAPAGQIILTAAEEHRVEWEPFSWFVRADRRYICESRRTAPLTLAAAVLSVGARSSSNIVAIIPSRCVVADEAMLLRTLSYALDELPHVPEGIVSLGMLDLEEGVDEDYFVVAKSGSGRSLQVQAYARRPVPWVARHLRENGALVASGILVGYAGALASHVAKRLPGLAPRLRALVSAAGHSRNECTIPLDSLRGIAPAILSSLRWRPPSLPMRVFGAARCGWCGLKSARSVARYTGFVEQLSALSTDASVASDGNDHANALSWGGRNPAAVDGTPVQEPLGRQS